MIFISLIGIIFLLFGIKPLVSSIKEKNIYAVVRLASFLLIVLTICIGCFLVGISNIKIETYNTVEEYNFIQKFRDIGEKIIYASCFILVLFPLIYISSVDMERKENEEKLKQQKRIDEKKKEEDERAKQIKLQELKYRFNSKSADLKKLTDQYYAAVCNYIDSLPFHPFCLLKDIDLNLGMLTSSYFDEGDSLLRFYIYNDGYTNYSNTIFTDEMNEVRKTTSFLVEELKFRITENWNDRETINSAVYFIIRNNVIRYYYRELKSDGIENLEEICTKDFADKKTELISDAAKAFYTYYWLYTNDINLSIKSTYDRISEEIDRQYELYLLQTKRDSFFSENISTLEESSLVDIKLEDNANILNTIDMMTGREFEEFIANFFRKQGYKTTLTPSSGDYGIDVIIENDFLKIGIQTKCYSDKVSNSSVQEAVTGLKHYGLDKAMVITNNYFQPSAIRLAKENNVILWDREKLEEELAK